MNLLHKIILRNYENTWIARKAYWSNFTKNLITSRLQHNTYLYQVTSIGFQFLHGQTYTLTDTGTNGGMIKYLHRRA